MYCRSRRTQGLSRIGIYTTNDDEHNLNLNLRMSIRKLCAACSGMSFDLHQSSAFTSENLTDVNIVVRGYGQDMEGTPNDVTEAMLAEIDTKFNLAMVNCISFALTANTTIISDSDDLEDKVCLLWDIPSLKDDIFSTIQNANVHEYPRFYSSKFGNVQVEGCPGQDIWDNTHTTILKHNLYVSWKPILRKQAHLEPFANAPISTVIGISPSERVSGAKATLRQSVYNGDPFTSARNQIDALLSDKGCGVRAEVEFNVSFPSHIVTSSARRLFLKSEIRKSFDYLKKYFTIHNLNANQEDGSDDTGLAKYVRCFPMSVCPSILNVSVNALEKLATPLITLHQEGFDVPAIEKEKLSVLERITNIAFSGDMRKLPGTAGFLGLSTNLREKSAPWIDQTKMNFRTNRLNLSLWPRYQNTNVMKFAHHSYMAKSKKSRMRNDAFMLLGKIASETQFALGRLEQTQTNLNTTYEEVIKLLLNLVLVELDIFLANSLTTCMKKYTLPIPIQTAIQGIETAITGHGPQTGHLSSRDALTRFWAPILNLDEIKDDPRVLGFTSQPITVFDWIQKLQRFVGTDEPPTSSLCFPKAFYIISSWAIANTLENITTKLHHAMTERRNDLVVLPRFQGKSKFLHMAFYEVTYPDGDFSLAGSNALSFIPSNPAWMNVESSLAPQRNPMLLINFSSVDTLFKNKPFLDKFWHLHVLSEKLEGRSVTIPSPLNALPQSFQNSFDPYNSEQDLIRLYWAYVMASSQTEKRLGNQAYTPRKNPITPSEYFAAGIVYMMCLIRIDARRCAIFSDKVWQVKISLRLFNDYKVATSKRSRSSSTIASLNITTWRKTSFLTRLNAEPTDEEKVAFLLEFRDNFQGISCIMY